MNLNQIMNMIIRIFVRKGVNWGINKSVDLAARRGKPAATMSKADHQTAQQTRDMAKRARKLARITGRIGR
jgi:hypothetical protein